jgi:peptidoglycan/LPS O-acetylase OafA/YrhL
MVPVEYHAHTHAMFWTGMALSPLLLQGWIPEIATFLNTPAWTMSAESAYYLAFPWVAAMKAPAGWGHSWPSWPGCGAWGWRPARFTSR